MAAESVSPDHCCLTGEKFLGLQVLKLEPPIISWLEIAALVKCCSLPQS